MNNGSRVEIQQDDEHSLVVRLAECEANHRPSCAVVDKDKFFLPFLFKYVSPEYKKETCEILDELFYL